LSHFTCPFHPILALVIIKSLGFLLVLFTFIGNKFNQASAAKKRKRSTKEENKVARRQVDEGGTMAVRQPYSQGQGVATASLS